MPLDPQSGVVNLIMGAAALATLVTLVRSRRSFFDHRLGAGAKRLAVQSSVFLVPPVVVLLHELGHVAAVVAVGAQVVGFSYGFFEGSVAVAGHLSAADAWLVSISGNVVGAATGLLLAFAGLRGKRLRPGPRYVLVLGGVLQVAYALVGYPVLSLSSNWGDWVTIYDFGATPTLSLATGAVHAFLLAALWRWWRGTVRHTLFAISSGTAEEMAALQESVRSAPGEADRWLALANLYAGHGELGLARSTLDQAVTGPVPGEEAARLHLGRARLAMFQGNWSSAATAAEDGLRAVGAGGGEVARVARDGGAPGDGTRPPGPPVGAPDGEVVQRLWANQGLALASMERPDRALAAFSRVKPPVGDDARVRYGRGLARLGAGDVEGGRRDLESVVAGLPPGHLLRTWAEARLAGRAPDPPDDSDRPNYMRRSQPPPAPIAGL